MTKQEVWDCDICGEIRYSPMYSKHHLILDDLDFDLCSVCHIKILNMIQKEIEKE